MANKRNVGRKLSSGARVKPTMIKAGVTKSRDRRYECGGKLKKC